MDDSLNENWHMNKARYVIDCNLKYTTPKNRKYLKKFTINQEHYK